MVAPAVPAPDPVSHPMITQARPRLHWGRTGATPADRHEITRASPKDVPAWGVSIHQDPQAGTSHQTPSPHGEGATKDGPLLHRHGNRTGAGGGPSFSRLPVVPVAAHALHQHQPRPPATLRQPGLSLVCEVVSGLALLRTPRHRLAGVYARPDPLSTAMTSTLTHPLPDHDERLAEHTKAGPPRRTSPLPVRLTAPTDRRVPSSTQARRGGDGGHPAEQQCRTVAQHREGCAATAPSGRQPSTPADPG